MKYFEKYAGKKGDEVYLQDMPDRYKPHLELQLGERVLYADMLLIDTMDPEKELPLISCCEVIYIMKEHNVTLYFLKNLEYEELNTIVDPHVPCKFYKFAESTSSLLLRDSSETHKLVY